jgi:hypothetical protein
MYNTGHEESNVNEAEEREKVETMQDDGMG